MDNEAKRPSMHTVSHMIYDADREGKPAFPLRGGQKFITQITPWAAGHASLPFEVILQEITESQVVLLHERPLEIGLRHVLNVPREGGKPTAREYIVERCTLRADANYEIILFPTDAKGRRSAEPAKRRVAGKQFNFLFLLFGIFGLLVAMFAPL